MAWSEGYRYHSGGRVCAQPHSTVTHSLCIWSLADPPSLLRGSPSKMAMAASAHFATLSSSSASSSLTARSMPNPSSPKRFPAALQYNGLRISTFETNLHHCVRKAVASYRGGRHRRVSMPLTVVCSTTGSTIIIVSFEAAPWSKTGGLGDVVGGLAPALVARGHRVMTFSPRHDQYKDAWDTNVTCELLVGDKVELVRFFHTHKRGVDRVFVDHPLFLAKVWGKAGSKLYGPSAGKDYNDNQLRFSLFVQAAIEAALILNLSNSKFVSGPYGEDVIFVANDWHSALLACYLKANYQSRGLFKNAKVAFCIHNIAYQGRFAPPDFSLLNLPDSMRSSLDFFDGYSSPVKGWKINWMKAGMLESDIVITVSPNYALEILSGPDRGVELHTIGKKTGLEGIVNGMDVIEWDPSTDKYLEVNYDSATVFEAKPALKEALQAEVGLPVDPSIPILGFIGRLEEQKGSDILAAALPEILKDNVQVIVLGTGKKALEKQLEELEEKYPDKARGVVKFNVPLAHLIIAASDFMLVPSRFEPCGLNQLYAMRYGTIPVVTSTGGLVDTVKEGVTGFLTGKPFNVKCEEVDPTDVQSLITTVRRAVKTYGTPSYKKMVEACMAQDLSWKGPAKRWEEVLLSLKVQGSKPGVDGDEVAPRAKEKTGFTE
ncbi:hypothetical protein GOP47_0020476 [Adiantum capillus-veneris]|uniref:Starch synthase, chloroplastic/amyloplastic n=1 Tax=Adiantum capillus-veneris TaxID=13818 RepID=A0A9D4Z8Q8_ADICA|nr:hypothetical protein GOP47_0020476 [Adiantum capillus-veneris]